MGEPITKQQREAMREDAANARHAFCRDDVPRLLDALEAAEADAQRLTAELERLRPLAEAATDYVAAMVLISDPAETNRMSAELSKVAYKLFADEVRHG